MIFFNKRPISASFLYANNLGGQHISNFEFRISNLNIPVAFFVDLWYNKDD